MCMLLKTTGTRQNPTSLLYFFLPATLYSSNYNPLQRHSLQKVRRITVKYLGRYAHDPRQCKIAGDHASAKLWVSSDVRSRGLTSQAQPTGGSLPTTFFALVPSGH
jgi:hypothetical protein